MKKILFRFEHVDFELFVGFLRHWTYQALKYMFVIQERVLVWKLACKDHQQRGVNGSCVLVWESIQDPYQPTSTYNSRIPYHCFSNQFLSYREHILVIILTQTVCTFTPMPLFILLVVPKKSSSSFLTFNMLFFL